MKIHIGTSIGLLVLLTTGTQALAQSAASRSAQAAEERKLGSVHLRCDGQIAYRSGAEVAGRVMLIVATGGLLGGGERPDADKRLTGAAAVAACDAAIADETDPIRKIQLMLARSIHHVEVKNYEAALSDAQAAPAVAGDGANELGFRHSLLISAFELEAAALVRLGRPAEAEAAALKMAAASPYDIVTQQRASRYLFLTDKISPAKRDYIDRLARLWPRAFTTKALAEMWAGEYIDAAADYSAYMDLVHGYETGKEPEISQPALHAGQAVALAMGGDMQQSNAIAADTRKTLDDLIQSGKALNMQSTINAAGELLDFQAVVAELAGGRVAQARAMFAARSRWLVTPVPVVVDLTARLREGASTAELTGPLANEPATLRAKGLAANAGAITGATDADKLLYAAIHAPITAHDYGTWSGDVWDVGDSSFVNKKTGKEKYAGDYFYVARPSGVVAGDVIYMHAALLARARGKSGYVVFPDRTQLSMTIVRFGDAGDPGVPARGLVNAGTVIAALSEEFPDPSVKTPKK